MSTTRERCTDLDPARAVALAREAGERGLQAFMAATGLCRREAIRALQRRKQAGRTPSECMAALLAP